MELPEVLDKQNSADNVKMLLLAEGLKLGLAQSSSRGEMDAKGTHEGEWSFERRVD